MNERRSKQTRLFTGALFVAAGWLTVSVGCVSVAPDGHDEEVLSADITTTPTELKTLDEVSFAIGIENMAGQHMTNMAEVRLEIREPGSEWRAIDVALMTDHYVGLRTFASSGDYELRVLGMEHMGHALEEMHIMTIHVERAHADAGPFHIEYESEPGHIHAGEEAVLMFWVALDDGGAAATGLTGQIVVEESDGHVTTLEADEGEPGVYSAMMGFVDGGEAHVAIVLLDENGQEVEVDFHFDVADVH